MSKDIFDFTENETKKEQTMNTDKHILSDNKYACIISENDYRAVGGVGSTLLSTILDNPIKYKQIVSGELKLESKAFDLGTVFHTLALEPNNIGDVAIISDTPIPKKVKDIFDESKDYVVIPDEFLTASGALSTAKNIKQEYEEWLLTIDRDVQILKPSEANILNFLSDNQDKVIITEADRELMQIGANNAYEYLPNFDEYFKNNDNGVSEVSFFAILYADKSKADKPLTFDEAKNLKQDDELLKGGVLCQARIDRIYKDINGNLHCYDLKSTKKEATDKSWVNSSGNFCYDLQEAHYRKVLKACGVDVLSFIFAYCSLLEYGGAGYKEHHLIDKEEAKSQHTELIKKIVYCVENDKWSVQTYTNGSGFATVSAPTLPAYTKYRI